MQAQVRASSTACPAYGDQQVSQAAEPLLVNPRDGRTRNQGTELAEPWGGALRQELGDDGVDLEELVVLGAGAKLDMLRAERDQAPASCGQGSVPRAPR